MDICAEVTKEKESYKEMKRVKRKMELVQSE